MPEEQEPGDRVTRYEDREWQIWFGSGLVWLCAGLVFCAGLTVCGFIDWFPYWDRICDTNYWTGLLHGWAFIGTACFAAFVGWYIMQSDDYIGVVGEHAVQAGNFEPLPGP
ncbi:uncharacterized protein BO97DRAFT_442919 [Aspergillus homomorphus CBS 101889]|uniref:Uncharacterized protein n=1 Tax=Aspergillus homomorphus (strain CBS 101889) TaxID=1450537 RepID=A0A395HXN0_ASPHC|nr:hypothetical protein BO97DRAFT_442919 [Aspergillus homomorphus CBS 101889]RAL12681.1 hypothetical protein BO97DRAFT_442919 [Aspergillus homomorphus CBS 101889]